MRLRLMLRVGLCLVITEAIHAVRAEAQRSGTPGTIEIRGQVPTPQVVTVRPREIPRYSRQVLVPAFYDRTFRPSALPAYQLVSLKQVLGAALAGANAPPSAPALELEIEALRRDLEYRRARLDSIAEDVRNLGVPRPDSTGRPPAVSNPGRPPADSSRRPPADTPSRPPNDETDRPLR